MIKKTLILLTLASMMGIDSLQAHTFKNTLINIDPLNDSIRLAEIDRFWIEASRTVREGDFEGYRNTYHQDAVVIFASGKNKASIPVSKALEGWKQGFTDTKNRKVNSDVEFRFSQRIGDSTTAHETGIFHYSSIDTSGKVLADIYVHFEMLLIKKNGKWLGMMEYQKSNATQNDWKVLK